MPLDIVKQNVRSIADAIKEYRKVELSENQEDIKKKEQLKNYILRLCYNVQKSIDDERAVL